MNVDTQAGITNRRLIIEDIVSRTGIDEAMIESLVRTFYARVRHDPLIGPVFESKVQDWDAHIGRLCTFWSSVALMSGRYHGQPMAVHLPLPIDTPHFDRWLEIFAATARDVCPPAAAAHFLDRASRIADSLELGIAAQKGEIRSKRTRACNLPDLRKAPAERQTPSIRLLFHGPAPPDRDRIPRAQFHRRSGVRRLAGGELDACSLDFDPQNTHLQATRL